MKSKYWSCSKFADWVRGTPKPTSRTNKEWDAWEKSAKKKVIRYWLAEEGFDYLQNFITWPSNRVRDIRCYINNRWVIKSHALTSNLKRGSWHDFDACLLHAVFDELINFVEIQLAWKLIICSDEERKKYKTPWYHIFFRFKLWRSSEAGITYLKWAAELKNDEDWMDKNDPSFDQPTFQALAAQETLFLYTWWKEDRPKRLEPSQASGWSKYCDEQRTAAKARGDLWWSGITNRDEESKKILDIYYQIEKEYEEEDTAMLIRLIKIRQELWT